MKFSRTPDQDFHCLYPFEINLSHIPRTNSWEGENRTLRTRDVIIVGEPKSRIVQKHTFFAPERYTAGILYTDSLNSA